MRLLVVGGAGFVGSHLVRRCIAGRAEVHALLRPTTDGVRLSGLLPAAHIHRLSLSDAAALRDCLSRVAPTHIFHLAGRTASRHDGSLAAAIASVADLSDLMSLIQAATELAEPPRMFIRTGSIAEYGEGAIPFVETQREYPSSGYAAAALAGTHYACAVSSTLPFPIATARLSLVYGPGQAEDFLIPGLIASALDGMPLIVRRERDRRDVLHVDDAVDALWLLARMKVRSGEIVNVGSDSSIGVGELAGLVARIAGGRSRVLASPQQSEPVTLQLSIERLRTLTAWQPRIGIAEGIASLVAHMRRTRTGVAA